MEQSAQRQSIGEVTPGGATASAGDVLVAEGIWKYYSRGPLRRGRGPVRLIDVSVSLRAGELACICGRSGQGKSTLLRILALDDEPSEGKLVVLGREVGALTRSEKDDLKSETIHYIPQRHMGLLPRTAVDTVAYWLIRLDGLSPLAAEQKARAALESVGLPPQKFLQRVDQGFSGGEGARVALAAAFARRRPICLADEVYAGLDLDSAIPLVGLFRVLCRRGAAVAIIVHQPELRPYFDRVITIADKRLASDEYHANPMIALHRPLPEINLPEPATRTQLDCPTCGRANSAAEIYCRFCLNPLRGTETCPCGRRRLPLDARFCTSLRCARRL
jgi:ABC-type lipoprotein export system ATPase subunit